MSENIQEKIENKIIDHIVLGSLGRLLVVKPEGQNQIADLIVKRKGEYEDIDAGALGQKLVIRSRAFSLKKKKPIKEVFLAVFGEEKIEKADIFKKEIDISRFANSKDLYLVFALFDDIKQDIEDPVYIIPLEKFKKDDDKQKFAISKKNLSGFFIDKT